MFKLMTITLTLVLSCKVQLGAAMPPEGSTRIVILSGCPSLDKGSQEAEVGFEPRTFRNWNMRRPGAAHSVAWNIRLTETRGLRLPDEPQEERNRSWAAEEFSATL
ncbi:hypothetical protein CSKR_104919 [Clonorchis sinensis]|uniref:Secreted protein n=1 Tax=Clonorchis sinensis TaxID=79923 RepID=A0A3R7CKJ1_CLOSI|nr:hypothetical protein CSKR_104919 [Clonorchis sinensis]